MKVQHSFFFSLGIGANACPLLRVCMRTWMGYMQSTNSEYGLPLQMSRLSLSRLFSEFFFALFSLICYNIWHSTVLHKIFLVRLISTSQNMTIADHFQQQ